MFEQRYKAILKKLGENFPQTDNLPMDRQLTELSDQLQQIVNDSGGNAKIADVSELIRILDEYVLDRIRECSVCHSTPENPPSAEEVDALRHEVQKMMMLATEECSNSSKTAPKRSWLTFWKNWK